MRSFSSLAIAALLSAFTGNASPLAIEKRAITDGLFSDMGLMSQYASAAYCSGNYNSPGDKVSCNKGKCPLVQAADSNTTAEYTETNASTDVTGYIAVDHTNKLIIISFRGTKTPENWITNLDLGMDKTDICPTCSAHRGFWRSWTEARHRVLPAVTQAVADNPSYEIRATGHSLGGAIATLAAASMRNEGHTVALYTYGAPRIGGRKTSDFISKQAGGNYRITHWNDPVPQLPLLIMGYVHTSPEYYINKPNEKTVSARDIQVFEGPISFQGNGQWIGDDVEAHMWYFGSVRICDVRKMKRGVLGITGVKGGEMEVMTVF
ncbi:hypothetical protein COCVIDRAFT_33794 [Bipolaris victoriae FI3]|uniref:Fungal lipase-like domain-containing protein n=1 Tax=Bipolaris victoriae (strain FI3) TaxID=930091 RepID=W7ETT7_BIPV3|nr:hypothetical protein COCVIDRAFT_33794 [Bipolaris victoriae FI3]